MDLNDVEVTFGDGEVRFRGKIVTDEDARISVTEAGDIHEVTKTIQLYVVEDGEMEVDGVVSELEPGIYMVTHDGLYRRVTGSPTIEG